MIATIETHRGTQVVAVDAPAVNGVLVMGLDLCALCQFRQQSPETCATIPCSAHEREDHRIVFFVKLPEAADE